MARGIVRLSIDGPSPNNELQKAKRKLTPAFKSVPRTASMEGYATPRDLIQALIKLLEHLDNELPDGFDIDHLWIYLDKRKASKTRQG